MTATEAEIRAAKAERRARRVERRLARARIVRRVIAVILWFPTLTAIVALSIYIRTSPWPAEDALRHLAARSGCEAADYVGLAPATRGQLGYHERNDPNDNGVACEEAARYSDVSKEIGDRATGAKFVRP